MFPEMDGAYWSAGSDVICVSTPVNVCADAPWHRRETPSAVAHTPEILKVAPLVVRADWQPYWGVAEEV